MGCKKRYPKTWHCWNGETEGAGGRSHLLPPLCPKTCHNIRKVLYYPPFLWPRHNTQHLWLRGYWTWWIQSTVLLRQDQHAEGQVCLVMVARKKRKIVLERKGQGTMYSTRGPASMTHPDSQEQVLLIFEAFGRESNLACTATKCCQLSYIPSLNQTHLFKPCLISKWIK